jgi:hypothetical protein
MPNIKDIKELEFYNLLLRYGEGKVTKSELWSWIETALTTQQKEWERKIERMKVEGALDLGIPKEVKIYLYSPTNKAIYNQALDDILSLLRKEK